MAGGSKFGVLPPQRVATGSLFSEIRAAGIPHDHHESDLYILDTPEARTILTGHGMAEARRSFFTGSDGKRWMDVPFAYDPWWEARIPHHNRARGYVLSSGARSGTRAGAHRASRTRRHLGASVNRTHGGYHIREIGRTGEPMGIEEYIWQVRERLCRKHHFDALRADEAVKYWATMIHAGHASGRIASLTANDISKYERGSSNRAGRSSGVWYVVGYNYPKGHRDRRIKYQGGTFPTREAAKEAMQEGRRARFYMHVTRKRPKGWYESAAA